MSFDKGALSVDMYTITALYTVGALSLSVILWVLARWYAGHIARATRFCAYSFATAGTGSLLTLFRPSIPDLFSRTFALNLILAGFIGFYVAVKTLKQEKVNLPYWWALIFTNLGLFSWFTYVESDLPAGLITLNLCTIAALIPLSFTLVFKVSTNHRIIWQITGLGFAVILAVFIVRTAYLAINYSNYLTMSGGGVLPAFFFEGFYWLPLLGGLLFMLIVTCEATAQLSQRAILDPLTGIYNRRGFQEVAGKVLKAGERLGRTNALLVLDLDHFKSVNDRYGHSAGDQVLKRTVEALAFQLRAEDILGRYGGEEFVVLLPNAVMENAKQVAERLRQAVQCLAYSPDLPSLRITVSVGLATDEGKPKGLESLFNEADKALYQAKKQGRNRIISTVV